MSARFVRSLALFAFLLSSCTSSGTDPAPQLAPTAVAAQANISASLIRILELEDRRSTVDGVLFQFALDPNVVIRTRAVRALGRLPLGEHGSEVTEALERAFTDVEPAVREIAAFGLGLRADPASAAALLKGWKDPVASVRARIVEAASRFDDPGLREEVLYSLADPSPLVRAEAATGPSRWDPEASTAPIVNSALVNIAAKAPSKMLQKRLNLPKSVAEAVEPEELDVIWRTLATLSRRKSNRARDVYYLWCRSSVSVEARIFATRGLANLESSDEAVLETLRECMRDKDWRVVVEAAKGLGNFPEPSSTLDLHRAMEHPNSLVRLSTADALGFFKNEKLLVRPILESTLVDLSPSVQASAIRSLARLFGAETAPDLQTRALSGVYQVRKAVAQSCEFLPATEALPILDKLVHDADRSVAYAAAEGLVHFLDQGGRERARELLGASDNGIRLAAVLVLQENPVPGDLQGLARCYRSTEGDISDEIRFEILVAAASLKRDPAFELLRVGMEARNAYTRNLAYDLMAKNFPGQEPTQRPDPPRRRGLLPETLNTSGTNRRVEVRTTRGTLVFELHEDIAPVHAYNFIELARSEVYEGLRFHRVVPNFVVQGADYRGDGNGGVSWRGQPLRHEFSELKYGAGALGMPRNADPNSGGSQWFVTHAPTPHLDGRYTLFGQLVQGFDVLGLMEEGDHILSIRIREE